MPRGLLFSLIHDQLVSIVRHPVCLSGTVAHVIDADLIVQSLAVWPL